MDVSFQAHLIYALGWLSFGAVHSILAAPSVQKRLLPFFGVAYRLCYNLFAMLHIGGVMALGGSMLSDQAYSFEPGVAEAMIAIRILGVVVLLMALREYDLSLLSGLKQIRTGNRNTASKEDETLVTDGLHRFVRHPLYLGVYMIFWGGAVSDFGLATAVWGSLYLFIGARHEERSLSALYGEAYAEYQKRVPAVIPWKGRV